LEAITVSETSFIGIVTTNLSRDFGTFDIPSTLSDDVNNTEKSVGTIKGGTWPTNNFHSINEVYIKRTFGADVCFVINIVVQSMPILQHQYAGIVICRSAESSNPKITVVPIRSNIKAIHTLENIGQGAVAIFFDFVSSHDRD